MLTFFVYLLSNNLQNIQERKNNNGITFYRIRLSAHRDVNGKQRAVFEKSIKEMTATDAHMTFDNYARGTL